MIARLVIELEAHNRADYENVVRIIRETVEQQFGHRQPTVESKLAGEREKASA
jgi:hypothetical protein